MHDAGSTGTLWLALLLLAEQATRDHLTGLYNRRYFDETLSDHVAAAARYNRPLSLILLDIDNFKHINDSNGHDAGDQALRAFADLLRNTARSADILCRFGGDEFAVIMPETDKAAAEKFIGRLQGESAASPAFTAGIATLPCGDIVADADADLLARKRESRPPQSR